MSAWQVVQIVAALVVLARVINLVAHINLHTWSGARAQLVGFSLGAAVLAGGALGTALGAPIGPSLLLVGLAAWIVFDRRRKI